MSQTTHAQVANSILPRHVRWRRVQLQHRSRTERRGADGNGVDDGYEDEADHSLPAEDLTCARQLRVGKWMLFRSSINMSQPLRNRRHTSLTTELHAAGVASGFAWIASGVVFRTASSPLLTPAPGAKHPVPLLPMPTLEPGTSPACNMHTASHERGLVITRSRGLWNPRDGTYCTCQACLVGQLTRGVALPQQTPSCSAYSILNTMWQLCQRAR